MDENSGEDLNEDGAKKMVLVSYDSKSQEHNVYYSLFMC